MSHRHDCPDRWSARREGERAFEYGRGSYANPYDDFHRDGNSCEEAARAWNDGYRAARYEQEEREREAEEHQRRESQYRREIEEQQYYEEMEQQHYQEEQFTEPTETEPSE